MNCQYCKHWHERLAYDTLQRVTSEPTKEYPLGMEFRSSFSTPGGHWRNTEQVSQIVTHTGVGDCDNPKLISTDPDGAMLDSGHDGDISFGKDFGCIHFTPKP